MLRKSAQECREFAQEIVSFYPRILPPLEVISEAATLSNGWMNVAEIGKSQKGHSIQLFSQTKTNYQNALLYGFPDPGEAVGGTGLLCLMRALRENHPFLMGLDYNWNFIPCLNFDDQPNEGKTLEKVMKTSVQEVDWLVHAPRPETTALLDIASKLRPKFVFPLHDEWHCHEEIPSYMPVSKPLQKDICDGLRDLLKSFSLKISTDINDSQMGEGFLNMETVADIKNSTFFEFGKHGTVFICEMPDLMGQDDSQVIAAQLAAGLFVAANI